MWSFFVVIGYVGRPPTIIVQSVLIDKASMMCNNV